jgi:putative ABC transport system permease protein
MKAWRTALRIAWREGRAAKGKFLFVILAVAVGVACITGVRGFAEAFRAMLLREARTLMAADLSIRTFEPPNERQTAAMDRLQQRGVTLTRITETVSMISAPEAADPLLVSVKAVDPAHYPFYGQIRLNPPGGLRQVLTPETVIVSQDLELRLGATVGDSIRLGEQLYRIGGIVVTEPDRMTGSLNVGPRVMISREGLERSGLMVPGSRASHRFLFKLPPEGLRIGQARASLQRVFREGMIADYTQTHPLLTRGLNRATTFLTLVSLLSLIVGALGVATAMHSHLRQRMDAIAVMKCLGARSGQIIRIYLLQTVLLGLAGSLAGVAFGLAVQGTFPWLIARYFPAAPALRLDWISSLQGLGAGILITLLFTWPPLASIRRIRPSVILRRDMPEARTGWLERYRSSKGAVAGAIMIVAGLGAVAASLTGGDLEIGAWFAGGLVVSLLVLAAFGKLLLAAIRVLLKRLPFKPAPTVSHGLANLYRPGNQAPFVLAALGLGVMFTLTIFLLQRSMLLEMFRSAPPGMPNVFLINLTDRDRAGLLELLRAQPGVESPPEVVAAVPARLQSVNGVPVEKLGQGSVRRYRRTRSVTWSAEKPAHTEIVKGEWWQPGRQGEALVSVAEDAAEHLRIAPGAELRFESSGRIIAARVANIHRTESVRPGSSIEFIFTPGSLDGLPAIYFGGMRVRAKDVAALQRAAYRRYPTVTIVNAADVLEIIQEVVDQIALVVRFVSFFAVLAGAVVLASSIAGTRLRRMREVAIFKALGATRGRVAGIFSIELLVLGSMAGLVGSILASGFSALLLKHFFDADFQPDLLPNLLAIFLTALLAIAAGWIAGYRFLAQKPLEALRHE